MTFTLPASAVLTDGDLQPLVGLRLQKLSGGADEVQHSLSPSLSLPHRSLARSPALILLASPAGFYVHRELMLNVLTQLFKSCCGLPRRLLQTM